MTHLIDKDRVVAEIKRRMDENRGKQTLPQYFGMIEEDLNILSFLDTIEVKEVDLDSERRKYLTEHFNVYEDGILQSKRSNLPLDTYDVIKLAKHFFELGLKESNPLTWQDVKLLSEIGEDFMNSRKSDSLSEEEYYQEILKRFKAQKGEEA